MTTTQEAPAGNPATAPEQMKSLALGMVGDLGRLLREEGLGKKPVKIVEALVFAMFFVTEAFVTTKKGNLEEASPALDRFHDAMMEYIFQEIYFKKEKAADMAEIQDRFNRLRELINQRYQEYRQGFAADFQKQNRSFENTLTALLAHLFTEPLAEAVDQAALFPGLSQKLAYFWTGCLMSFSPAGKPVPQHP
jgi:hypothetical protein